MGEGTAQGRPRSALDLIIAATAEADCCVMAAMNEREFAEDRGDQPGGRIGIAIEWSVTGIHHGYRAGAMVIAATTAADGCVVATRNGRDFEGVEVVKPGEVSNLI